MDPLYNQFQLYAPPSPPKLLRKTKQNEKMIAGRILARKDIHKKRHTIILDPETCVKGSWHFFVDLKRDQFKKGGSFFNQEQRDKEISRLWKEMHPEGIWTTDIIVNNCYPEEYQFINCPYSDTKFDLKAKTMMNVLTIYCDDALRQLKLMD